MAKHVRVATIVAVIALTPCFATTSGNHDGSTKAKAIPLKQRDPTKAVQEEMDWMMKRYHYTPLLATRDAALDSVRRVKAEKKPISTSAGWEHATVDHNGHLISYWWFATPHGKRDVYFDTGTF